MPTVETTQIEEARPEHFGSIAEIYNEYIRLGNATMEEILKVEADIASWVKKFNDREKLYVLSKSGTCIGWGIIKRYSDRAGYRFTCETAVYLTFSECKKGYGTLMKKHLINTCKALEYRHLVAKIFASNKASIEYNLRLGYTVVGTQREIGFRNGQWQDVVIMQLLLDHY
ncbi:MAG: N-acetyltransferase family protein [Bacteroidota bacterium]